MTSDAEWRTGPWSALCPRYRSVTCSGRCTGDKPVDVAPCMEMGSVVQRVRRKRISNGTHSWDVCLGEHEVVVPLTYCDHVEVEATSVLGPGSGWEEGWGACSVPCNGGIQTKKSGSPYWRRCNTEPCYLSLRETAMEPSCITVDGASVPITLCPQYPGSVHAHWSITKRSVACVAQSQPISEEECLAHASRPVLPLDSIESDWSPWVATPDGRIVRYSNDPTVTNNTEMITRTRRILPPVRENGDTGDVGNSSLVYIPRAFLLYASSTPPLFSWTLHWHSYFAFPAVSVYLVTERHPIPYPIRMHVPNNGSVSVPRSALPRLLPDEECRLRLWHSPVAYTDSLPFSVEHSAPALHFRANCSAAVARVNRSALFQAFSFEPTSLDLERDLEHLVAAETGCDPSFVLPSTSVLHPFYLEPIPTAAQATTRAAATTPGVLTALAFALVCSCLLLGCVGALYQPKYKCRIPTQEPAPTCIRSIHISDFDDIEEAEEPTSEAPEAPQAPVERRPSLPVAFVDTDTGPTPVLYSKARWTSRFIQP